MFGNIIKLCGPLRCHLRYKVNVQEWPNRKSLGNKCLFLPMIYANVDLLWRWKVCELVECRLNLKEYSILWDFQGVRALLFKRLLMYVGTNVMKRKLVFKLNSLSYFKHSIWIAGLRRSEKSVILFLEFSSLTFSLFLKISVPFGCVFEHFDEESANDIMGRNDVIAHTICSSRFVCVSLLPTDLLQSGYN